MLVVGGGLCPGTSINDRQADRTPGQPLTKSCSPCPQPQPGVPSCQPPSVEGGVASAPPPRGGRPRPKAGPNASRARSYQVRRCDATPDGCAQVGAVTVASSVQTVWLVESSCVLSSMAE